MFSYLYRPQPVRFVQVCRRPSFMVGMQTLRTSGGPQTKNCSQTIEHSHSHQCSPSYGRSVGQPTLRTAGWADQLGEGRVSLRGGTKSPRDLTELHRSRVDPEKVWGRRPPMQLKTGHNGGVHRWKIPLRQQIVFLLFIIIFLLKSQILVWAVLVSFWVGIGDWHEASQWKLVNSFCACWKCLLMCAEKRGDGARLHLLLLLCLRRSGGARTPRRLMEPPRVATPGAHVNVWFGLGRLRTDGMWQCREVNSIRDGEKSERKGEKEGTGTHLHVVPGWFESLRNKRIALDGLDVLYPSHLLLQRNSLWNTCFNRRKPVNKSARTPGTHADTRISPVIPWKGPDFIWIGLRRLYVIFFHDALWHPQYEISDIPLF